MTLTFLKKGGLKKPPLSVKYLLHQRLSDFDKARPISRIHASALTQEGERAFCPRYYALHDVTKQKLKDEWLTTSQRMTFQIGRDQEKNIVNWLGEDNRAICDWKCVYCGHKHEFMFKPMKCTKCGCKVTDPVEIRFQSSISGASCGIDLLAKLDTPKLVPVELKTLDKEVFKTLEAPQAEHKWRTTYYLRLIAESDSPLAKRIDTTQARILYVSKGGFGCADTEMQKFGMNDKFSPFKEFTIKRDDKLTDSLHLMAKTVTDFREGTVGMPKGICPSSMCKRAKACSIKGACFSGEHPAEYDWNA